MPIEDQEARREFGCLVGHVATIEAQRTASPGAADASSMHHQSSQLTVSENDKEQQPQFVHLNKKVSSGEEQHQKREGGRKNQRNKKHIVKVIMLSLTITTSAEWTTTLNLVS